MHYFQIIDKIEGSGNMMDWSDDEDFVNEGSGSGEESPVLAPSSREPVIVRITTKITEPWKIVKGEFFI